MFGQPNKPSLFGSPQTTNTAFGATGTGFGTPATTPFGVQPQPSTSLFGSTTNTFGGMGTSSGSNLFSNAQQTSIFGNTSTTQTPFGQSNTTSTFGRPAGGIFGSPAQGTSTIGQVSTGFGFGGQNAFGAPATQNVTGTTVKFVPTPGSDTMLKNGATQSISTRHQCITVMKEYENKSLEELRMEDYAANRKGPATGSTVGAFGVAPATSSLFGGSSSTSTVSGFGQGSGTSLFGNTQQKTTFGTPLTPATQSTTNLFGNTSFSKPTGFGTTSTFGTVQPQQAVQPQPQTNLFGSVSNTTQPFGQTNFFSNPAQNTAKPPLFGSSLSQPQQQTTSLFGTNTGFNTAANNTAPKSLFGSTTPAFSTGLGTSTTFPTFGTTTATTTTTSLFGTTNQSLFGNNASKPATAFSFGNPSQPTSFGTGLGQTTSTLNAGTSIFGSGGGFGSTGSSSLFQSSLGTQSSLFPSMQPSQPSLTGFPAPQPNNLMQGPQTNIASEMILTRLRTLPYGVSPLFQNDLNSTLNATSQFTTDAKTLNQYKLTAAEPTIKRVPTSNKPVLLFDDVDEDEESTRMTAADIFQPKKSIKKLLFAPKVDSDANRSASDRSLDQTYTVNAPTEVKKVVDSPVDNTMCEFIRNRESEPDRSRRGLNFSIETLPEDEESSLSNRQNASMPTFRCGLIQTRKDYYTLPKTEEIDNFYDEEKMTCIVDTFTIGRKGYGSIFWSCPVDLYGLNLDEIVHIRRKEVIVYPDDEDKPPVGEGLNKPAQITLDQVWPIDKNSHEIIKDVKRLEDLDYASKLEATTVKLGAIFKDYRPETGSWVFNVKHFSKYGLFDDDDDVDMEAPPHKSSPPKPSPLPIPRSHIETSPKKMDEDLTEKSMNIRPISSFTSSFTTSFEQIYNDLPKPEDYVYKGPMRPATEERSMKPSYPMFEYYDGIRDILFGDDDLQEPEQKPSKRSKMRSPPESLRISSPTLTAKQRATVTIPQVNITKRELKFLYDPFPSQNKVILDISSVKCSPSSAIKFFNGSRNAVHAKGRTVTISKFDTCPDISEDSGSIERFAEQLKSHTLIQGHEQHAPFADVRRKSVNPLNPEELNGLVEALYGDLKTKTEYEIEEERRNAVIDWISERNKSCKIPSQTFARIFYFLAINDVPSAVNEAIRTNQPRLALVIASGTCSLSKDEILSQLDSWKSSGADRFIEKDILKLYTLMSGQTHWTLSSDETIAAVEELTWSQQLALTLLYCPDMPMSLLIDSLPTDCSDVEYHLLAQHTKDQWPVLDYCADDLESWFLHQSLVSFNAIPSNSRSDCLHATVASQLMSQNVFWASFVAIHIADHSLRQRVLSEILYHNSPFIGPEEETSLEKSLLIHRNEIASAKATFSKSVFDDIGYCMALLDCGKWSQAHDLLLERIFPDLVVSEELGMLSELVERMRNHRNAIPNWYTNGAHIYDVYQQVATGKDSVLEILQKDPVSMHLMKCPTPKHVLAQSEMAHKICLFCSSHNASPDLISGAPLPDDYVLIHARKTAFDLIEKLAH